MTNIINQYLAQINLTTDDMTKNLLITSIDGHESVRSVSVIIRNNKYIVDIRLKRFSMEEATTVMNLFMERTRYPYSALYLRFNEGQQIRYRYASLKENKDGFYCDVVLS